MANRVQSRRSRSWVSRTALLAVLAGGPLAAPSALGEGEASSPARDEIERLRSEMELAYLDVQHDHGKVRAADWPGAALGEDFLAALTTFVADARARDGADPKVDVDAARLSARTLADRRAGAPLTRTTLPVVLVETAREARAKKSAAPREAFVAAARTVFAAPKVEDAWDAMFLGLPVVEDFRKAQQQAVAAQEVDPRPVAPGEKTTPTSPAEKPPQTTPPAAPVPGPFDELVFLDKARPWLGGWTGWPIPEKQNKRQQRAVKAIWIDRFETTCAQYKAFLDGLPAAERKAHLPHGWTLDDKEVAQIPAGKERHPVVGVTWRQAQAYAESVGKRLPTGDEWERAAAGVEKDPRLYPWGDAEEAKKWVHLGVEPKGTFAVDAFPDDATPEGVVGLAGNAAELVSTYLDRGEVPKAGPEKDKQLLVCGGSFALRASECVTSYRWVLDAEGASACSTSVGFRCVIDDAEYKKRKK